MTIEVALNSDGTFDLTGLSKEQLVDLNSVLLDDEVPLQWTSLEEVKDAVGDGLKRHCT